MVKVGGLLSAIWNKANFMFLPPDTLEAFVFAQPFSARRRDGFDSLGSFFIQGFVHSGAKGLEFFFTWALIWSAISLPKAS
jgi:hypothetical protein